MPCYKCSDGKYKYGKDGNCQFDSLAKCQEAERAVHARENVKMKNPYFEDKKDCLEDGHSKPYND